MKKIFNLVKKNLTLLIRAKSSSLIIFIGPLILVLLLGLAFSNSSTFSLTASVYSESFSDDSNNLIEKLSNQDFRVIKSDSLDSCKGSVRRMESQACIVFPKDLIIDENKPNEISFFVDYSRINLVWIMLDVMSAKISEESKEISRELNSDLLNRVNSASDNLNQAKSLSQNIESSGNNIRIGSEDAKSEIQNFDFSVNFAIQDMSTVINDADVASSWLDDIESELNYLSNNSNDLIENAQNSISNIESVSNDSTIISHTSDIDNDLTDIRSSINDAKNSIDIKTTSVAAKITLMKSALSNIENKINSTENKINNINNQRNNMLPVFEDVTSEINTLNSNLINIKQLIDKAESELSQIKVYDPSKLSNPITTNIQPIVSQSSHFNSLFPSLLTLIIMITGLLLSATLIVGEKKSRAFFRNHLTPTSYFSFSLATFLTVLLILVIQIIVFVSISSFFFESEIISSFGFLCLWILLVCSVFISIGMFLGYLFETEETVNLGAITLVTIFILFSNVIIPLESLPGYLHTIANYNPFVVSSYLIKDSLFFASSISEIWISIILLLGTLLFFIASHLILEKVFRKIRFLHFTNNYFTNEKDKKGSLHIRPIKFSFRKKSKEKHEKHNINELSINR